MEHESRDIYLIPPIGAAAFWFGGLMGSKLSKAINRKPSMEERSL